MQKNSDEAEWNALPERVKELVRTVYSITERQGVCGTCGKRSQAQADGSEYVHCEPRMGCRLVAAPDPLTALQKAFADYLAMAPSKNGGTRY